MDEKLDTERAHEIEGEITEQITQLIVSGDRTKERLIASMAAVANVLAMLTIQVIGKEDAPGIISGMINKAIENTNRCKKEMEDDET